MRVLFDDLVWVSYGYVFVEPQYGVATPDLIASRGGQRNGLCGAAEPGGLAMVTGTHTGRVAVRVESHADEPPLADDWEEVVEVAFVPADTGYVLTAFDFGVDLDVPTAVPLRARWCATGMDEAGGPWEGDVAPDRYLLQMWPAPEAPDAILRCTAGSARYWHSVAAETPPPQTPQERARARADKEAREARELREAEAREEVRSWGGRAPTDELRGWGHRGAALARLDRDLVDRLAALGPDGLRSVATLAATRACARADILDRAWVVAALDRVTRGESLPEPWSDFGSVWDTLYPPRPGIVPVATIGLAADHPPIPRNPAAAAIEAVLNAADPHPGAAAAGAVLGLCAGGDDLGTCLAEVREWLGT